MYNVKRQLQIIVHRGSVDTDYEKFAKTFTANAERDKNWNSKKVSELMGPVQAQLLHNLLIVSPNISFKVPSTTHFVVKAVLDEDASVDDKVGRALLIGALSASKKDVSVKLELNPESAGRLADFDAQVKILEHLVDRAVLTVDWPLLHLASVRTGTASADDQFPELTMFMNQDHLTSRDVNMKKLGHVLGIPLEDQIVKVGPHVCNLPDNKLVFPDYAIPLIVSVYDNKIHAYLCFSNCNTVAHTLLDPQSRLTLVDCYKEDFALNVGFEVAEILKDMSDDKLASILERHLAELVFGN